MRNDYKEALKQIAEGEPNPRAIAEEALEDRSQPEQGVVESSVESLHEIEETVDLMILDLAGHGEGLKRTLREAAEKLAKARDTLKQST